MKEGKRPFSILRRSAGEVKRYRIYRRIIPRLAGLLLLLLVIVYIISLLVAQRGSFTVSIRDYNDKRYALALSENESLAEEITQEAFFKALKNIGSFRGECKLSVWLCQIAKNCFYTAARRRNRQADAPLERIPDPGDMEQKLLDRETAMELHRLLHQLDEPYKEVFWMRTFGELSFAEIGRFWGKSDSWARVTYHRAKLKIREGMQ